MRVTSKGQVTIPLPFRKKLGLHPETEVEFFLDGNTLRLQKKKGAKGRGDRVVQRLKGRMKGSMTTEEIMKLTRGDDV